MRKIIDFNDLYGTDFNVRFFNAARMYWNNRYSFSCIDTPKTNDMLLLLYDCGGEYTLPDGRILQASAGSIVYAPYGARYAFRPTGIPDGGTASAYIVNFTLSLEDGTDFVLGDNAEILFCPSSPKYELLFSGISAVSMQNLRFPAKLKAGLYTLISELCGHFHKQNILSSRFQVISKGIMYLEENEELSMSVREIARLCNVSEIYFRKLFKEYSGLTPTAFRLSRKIERAKQYLVFEGKTVSETAALLGFSEVAYFCRLFKEKAGVTPGEYAAQQELRA